MIEGKKTIGLDADEVVFNTWEPIIELVKNKYGIELNKKNDFKNYDLQKKPSIKPIHEELMKIIHTEEFYYSLKPLPGVVESINTLAKNNWVFIISRRNRYFKKVTIESLLRSNIYFEDAFCVKEKIHKLKEIHADKFVDDNIDDHINVLPFTELKEGFIQVINNRPWNESFNEKEHNIIRAFGWIKKDGSDEQTIFECLQ